MNNSQGKDLERYVSPHGQHNYYGRVILACFILITSVFSSCFTAQPNNDSQYARQNGTVATYYKVAQQAKLAHQSFTNKQETSSIKTVKQQQEVNPTSYHNIIPVDKHQLLIGSVTIAAP